MPALPDRDVRPPQVVQFPAQEWVAARRALGAARDPVTTHRDLRGPVRGKVVIAVCLLLS